MRHAPGGYRLLQLANRNLTMATVAMSLTIIAGDSPHDPLGNTATSKLTFAECTENRISYVLSDRKEDGVVQPDQKITLESQRDQAKRSKR